MILQVILEGLGLGALLVLVCAVGIRKGAVGMVHLYSPAVQQRCVKLGLTSPERIRRNSLLFKAVCVPGYIAYVLGCVYAVNGAKGFVQGFWQLLVILSVMNLIDRFLVDGYWVGHTNAWTIPGTEDLKPYITAKDKQKKWLFGTVGMAVIAAALATMMTVQRPERPFRQRLFPTSRQSQGQRNENADRKDRIGRQTMKYAGMPFGMWMLFAGSFQKQLTAVLGYDAVTARAITKKAKPQYRQIIRRLPEFEKADRFKMNLVNCAMIGAFVLSMPQRPEVDRLTDYYARSMMTAPMQWFCRKSGKSKFSAKDIAAMKATAALNAADRNPYSWNMEFYEYPDGSGYEGRFTKCGICVLMKELGLYDLTPALCHLDYTMSEAGGVTDFVRQYTLASGGPYCDCGYKKKKNK